MFTIYQNSPEISFRMYVNGKAFLVFPPENFEINGTSSVVARNSQPEYPNGKCAFHLLFLLVPDLSASIRPGGDVRGNGTRTSHGNSHSGF